jgi:hypothetical protein
VIQHVSHRHKSICLCPFYVHAKNTGRNHHSDLTESKEGEVLILRHFVTDVVVICLDVLYLLLYLFEERRSFQPFLFFGREENWEVLKTLRENVNERMEESRRILLFLKNVSGQVGMLRTE